jgi:hypothetical protein
MKQGLGENRNEPNKVSAQILKDRSADLVLMGISLTGNV